MTRAGTHGVVAMPSAVAGLPREKHGRPVPWFVRIDPETGPDFRVVRDRGVPDAYRFELCWVCGQRRGRHAAFVLGPMCAVNRVAPEPPSHLACALYSAQACPFLTRPEMTRRTRGLPEDRWVAGEMIARNPGVALVWSSRTWAPFNVPREFGRGVLFNVGEPTEVSWWAQGRVATRGEVLASMDSGLPLLREQAEQDSRPEAAIRELESQHARALGLVPS